MNYTQSQFLSLIDEVEFQGGEYLDEMCVAKSYSFVGPNPKNKSVTLAGCGNVSIFELPYEGEDGAPSPIKLCAVCDDLGNTPRFAGVMS